MTDSNTVSSSLATLGASGWSVNPAYTSGGQPGDSLVDTPILIVGGDHPYRQWYGANGANGMAQMYTDQGITPYIAINTTLGGEAVGVGTDSMSWGQVQSLVGKTEIIGHGAGPHVQSWHRINTGFYIRYTGNGTAATVNVTGTFPAISLVTTVTGSGDGSAGFTFDMSLAQYDTIAEVVAAINASTGWSATLDPCLDGTESSNLMPVMIAAKPLVQSVSISGNGTTATVTLTKHGAFPGKTVTISGCTGGSVAFNGTWTITGCPTEDTFTFASTFNGASAGAPVAVYDVPMCLGGGLSFQYTGTAYEKVLLENTGTVLRLYGDGVQLQTWTLANASFDTLRELATAANGSFTGLVCLLGDNRRTETPAKESYLTGLESSASLAATEMVELGHRPYLLTCGLPTSQIIYRRLKSNYDVAAANGVTMENFSQSGQDFWPQHIRGADVFSEHRVNTEYRSIFPVPFIPALTNTGWHPGQQLALAQYPTSVYTLPILDALADSPGFAVDLFVHFLVPDGTSGYSISTMSSSGTADQNEGDWWAFLKAAKAKIASGAIRTMTPKQFRKSGRLMKVPKNMLFNPKFRAANGVALTGLTISNGGQGVVVPGVQMITPAQFTTVSIDSAGRMTLVSNATTSAAPVSWEVQCEPGKTYEFGMLLEVLALTSGNVFLDITAKRGLWKENTKAGTLFRGYRNAATTDMVLQFTMPQVAPYDKARVKSLAFSTIDLSVNNAIKVNIGGLGAIDNLNVAGGTPASTRPIEIANAINAAFASATNNATYGGQYGAIARVEGAGSAQKVVVESPIHEENDQAAVSISAATANSATAAIFGNANAAGGQVGHAKMSTSENFLVNAVLGFAMQGTVRISKPYFREVQHT